MGIAVLGPVYVDGANGVLRRRDRLVLAALAVRPGDEVSTAALADLLWGERLPASWAKILQGCVVRIRKVLGPDTVVTTSTGYRLVMAADDIDARRFEHRVDRARRLLDEDAPERAAYLLSEGLALWRGKALVDLEDWDPARAEAARLDEVRLSAEELYVESHLRSGQHERVQAKARALVEEAPLRERRWALLALAQYQAGRQAEALATLRRLRQVLDRELGLQPGHEIAELEEAVLRQDPDLVVTVGLPEAGTTCPYQGLLAYDVDDADGFFGRERDVAACLRRLSDVGTLAVVGPSGCGKSSLVRAGVAASLQRDGRPVAIITPGAHPMTALADLATGSRPALVVDQCEETFTLCSDPRERSAFLAALVEHARAAPLVLSFRADHLADIVAFPAFARAVEQGMYLLGALEEPDLRAAIEGPARAGGFMLEAGLVDVLIAEVADQPGALPLLSHALSETWVRREGRTLTLDGYRETGGVRSAVAQSAESVYARFGVPEQVVFRDLLMRLVGPGSAGEPVRRRLPRRLVVTDPQHDAMVELLVGSRLVTTDDGVVELAHEALARAWPRLQDWLADDVDGQRILHHLAGAADSWESLGRPDDELYRGARLAQALEWRNRATPQLTEVERDFLDAGEALSSAELRQAEERSRHQQRANRRLRALLVTAVALMLVAVAAGLVAVRQAGRADRQALLAEAGRAGVKAVVEPDIDRSLLLAVASARSERSSETLGSLLAALAKYPQLVRSIKTEQLDVTALEVSPDGTKAALHDVGGDVVVYDLATGAQVGSFRPRPAPAGALLIGVTSGGADYSPLDYSADGRVLAVGLAGLSRRPVRLLDPGTLRPLEHQQSLTFPVPGNLAKLEFSKDGTALLALTYDFADGIREPVTGATLAIWDVTPTDAGVRLTPRLRRSLGLESEAGLSPDGRIVYTTHPLTAYDARSGRVLWRRPGGGVEKLDVSPDGRLLALTSRDSDQTDVVLVDAATGQTRRRLAGHAGELTVARFSPSGATLVSTAVDRTGIVWNVATGRVVTRLPLSRSRVYGVGFSPDDSRLYTASDDGALRTWTLSGASRTLQQVKPPGEFVFGCTYPGPGGHRIATMGPKGIRFTNLATGHTTAWDKTFNLDDSQTCGRWHPDGRHFVTTALGIVRVFDSDTGRIIHEAKVQRARSPTSTTAGALVPGSWSQTRRGGRGCSTRTP